MTHIQIVMRLLEIRPGDEWVLHGTDYSGLTWLGDPGDKPTAEEIGL